MNLIKLLFIVSVFFGPLALANQTNEINLFGEVLSLNKDSIEMRDPDNKVLIVPKSLLHKAYRPHDLIQLTLTKAQFDQVQLKLKK